MVFGCWDGGFNVFLDETDAVCSIRTSWWLMTGDGDPTTFILGNELPPTARRRFRKVHRRPKTVHLGETTKRVNTQSEHRRYLPVLANVKVRSSRAVWYYTVFVGQGRPWTKRRLCRRSVTGPWSGTSRVCATRGVGSPRRFRWLSRKRQNNSRSIILLFLFISLLFSGYKIFFSMRK